MTRYPDQHSRVFWLDLVPNMDDVRTGWGAVHSAMQTVLHLQIFTPDEQVTDDLAGFTDWLRINGSRLASEWEERNSDDL